MLISISFVVTVTSTTKEFLSQIFHQNTRVFMKSVK